MKIVIPMEGRALSVMRSSSLSAQKQEDGSHELSGDDFHMGGILPEAVLLLSDTTELAEGDELSVLLVKKSIRDGAYMYADGENRLALTL